jgi:hypothetical protein
MDRRVNAGNIAKTLGVNKPETAAERLTLARQARAAHRAMCYACQCCAPCAAMTPLQAAVTRLESR